MTPDSTARCFAECPEPINVIATAGVALLAVGVFIWIWRDIQKEKKHG